MIKSAEATGRTEEDAINAALTEIGRTRDEILSVEVLEKARSGFFGIGSSPAKVRVSYEERDPKLVRTENFLAGLVENMGITADIQTEYNEDENLITVKFSGDNVGTLIGRRGETLDAIQHITNYVVNSDSGSGDKSRTRINIDAANYRAKRAESLTALAQKVAKKVLQTKRSVTLDPMNAYERHVIHSSLTDFEGISTYSTGTEPNRRVVVAYDRSSRADSARDAGKQRSKSQPRRQEPIPPETSEPEEKPRSREWY